MTNFKTYICTLLVMLLLPTNILLAQGRSESSSGSPMNPILTSGWYLGAGIGFNQFYGDVSEDSFFGKFSGGQTKFAFGLYGGKDITPWLSAQLEILSGNLHSTKLKFDDERPANLSFSSSYFEIGAIGKYFPLKMFLPDNDYSIDGYVFGGLSVANWVGELYDVTGGSETIINNVEPTSRMAIAMPLGIGGMYDVSDKISLNAEVSFRVVFSDQIDRVVGNYSSDVPLHFRIGVTYHLSRLDYFSAARTSRGRTVKETKPKKEKKSLFDFSKKEKTPKKSVEVVDEWDEYGITVMEYGHKTNFRDLVDESLKTKTTVDNDEIFTAERVRKMIDNERLERSQIGKSTIPDPIVYEIVESGANQPLVSEEGINFRVQILATSKRRSINELQQKYNTTYRIYEYYSGSIYKYTIGPFASYDDALRYSSQLHDMGVYDAFIVVYKDGKQIRLTSEMKN